jgi:hypothetical protein
MQTYFSGSAAFRMLLKKSAVVLVANLIMLVERLVKARVAIAFIGFGVAEDLTVTVIIAKVGLIKEWVLGVRVTANYSAANL